MRVLFIGNSYTFYNDMPEQVGRMIGCQTERVVEGGATLKVHWEQTAARERIDSRDFTHVVLQDKSTQSLHDRRDFDRYIDKLGRRVIDSGASLLLYETWARAVGHANYRWRWSGKSPEEMQRRVREAYREASERLGAEVVPVGDAWERCLARHPSLVLHDEDLHHASPLGSHLAAAVFLSTLGRSQGLDPRELDEIPDDVDPVAARIVRALGHRLVHERSA